VSARSSRNVLAAMMITVGMLMLFSAPLNAGDDGQVCPTFTINFDDEGEGALRSNNTSIGPVAIALPAGVYDIVMTSSDPTHGPGLFVDQLNESWFFTLDNGYVSPTTPDFGDAELGVSILVPGVTLGAATEITAQWAGQLPSADSVHATAAFTCARQTIPSTTSTAVAVSTSTVVAQSSTTVAASTSLPATTTSVVPSTTTPSSTTAAALLPTTMAPPTQPSTTTPTDAIGEIGGTTEENLEELAFTGIKINLAISGALLIAAGFGLVVFGSYSDRRHLELGCP